MGRKIKSAEAQAGELSNDTLAAILEGLANGMKDKPVLARYLTEAGKRLRAVKVKP